ncbi:MAG: outer membrane protein transport protein [Azonexus sp.]|nr:outer membrane protein transport protein [Azonexus sp.]
MSKTNLRLIPALIAIAFSGSAAAAGFQLQNQTGSGNGNAFAGAAAAAEDAGTIFFNPAGMTYLAKGHNISASGTVLYRVIDYSDTGSSASVASLGTTNGGNAGGFSLLPALYWAYSVTPTVSVGLGISPTFGNRTEYDFAFVGRNSGYFAEIAQININPSVAWKVNEQFSIGGGINIAHNETHFRQGMTLGGFAATTNNLDVKGDAWAFGYNLGAMFQITPTTRLGLTYRSELKFDLEGQQKASIGPVNGVTGSQDIKTVLKTPASASLALSQKVGDRLELLADYTWTNWSVVDVIQLQNRNTGANLSGLSYNFKDTWRVGLGANYQYNKDLKLRVGVAYDLSPVKSSADRSMTLPDSDRTWISIGAKYQLSPSASVDIGYSHIFFAKENTTRDVMSGAVPIQSIRGEWNNSVDIIAAQLNYKF